MKHLGRKLLLPVAAVALAGGTFAFLASNTVGASAAGEGQQTIAGYDVTNITYGTNYGAPCSSSDNQYASSDNSDTCIQSVSFDLDKAATPANVRAVLNTQGSNFSHNHIYGNCTQNNASGLWTCTPSANDVAAFGSGITTNTLQVIAAS